MSYRFLRNFCSIWKYPLLSRYNNFANNNSKLAGVITLLFVGGGIKALVKKNIYILFVKKHIWYLNFENKRDFFALKTTPPPFNQCTQSSREKTVLMLLPLKGFYNMLHDAGIRSAVKKKMQSIILYFVYQFGFICQCSYCLNKINIL